MHQFVKKAALQTHMRLTPIAFACLIAEQTSLETQSQENVTIVLLIAQQDIMEVLRITCVCFHSTARLWGSCITMVTTPQKCAFPNVHLPIMV
jgi:hypothetical protein